jgi:hypothetical protein
VILADVRASTFELACEPCGRRGRYNVERLIAKQGADMRLPELLTTLADCPKAWAFSIYDRCQVRYERYYGQSAVNLRCLTGSDRRSP